MIIKASAPCRISLFGGGSDIPNFASKYGGYTVGFGINLRQHFTFYTKNDMYGRGKDEFPFDGNPQFIYDVFNHYGVGGGHAFKVKSRCDAFLQSGLGSSAAAVVASLAAIYRIKDLPIDRNNLAPEAFQVESNVLNHYGGKQDAVFATYGGFNTCEFFTDDKGVEKTSVITLNRKNLEPFLQGMVLFWVGERKERIQDNLKSLTVKQEQALLDCVDMARNSLVYFASSDWEKIGKLLDIYWKKKKESNPFVTNDRIEEIYTIGKKNGALGFKLLGSGGGGYCVFVIDPSNKKNFLTQMAKKGMENIDFSLDSQGVETRIV